MQGIEIRIKGKVQGVGFRPFVWQIANRLDAKGEVLNDGEGVLVRLTDQRLTEPFQQLLQAETPPLAHIETLAISEFRWERQPKGFSIVPSEDSTIDTQVVPDAATCPQCLVELQDPANRRHHYPFINCTHCGPRFTIIKALPYDRRNTVMADFDLCPECRAEYQNPADRRYHAQPVACKTCGPRVSAVTAGDQPVAGHWLTAAVNALLRGQIVAIKSIGGFHLACDATNASAIATLRQRKRRQHKPFAVMVPDMAVARELAEISDAGQAQLESTAAPIVLLAKRHDTVVADGVAPGLAELGLMLPSNPIQHLLATYCQRPLVMTSGNRSGLPPALTNEGALVELAAIADLWLLHDRAIVQRCDDSLVRIRTDGSVETLRRARGLVPDALILPAGFAPADGYLAYGGDLKAAFAFGKGNQVIVSQYLGDLANVESMRYYQAAMAHFESLYQLRPKQHIVDCHPGYASHQYARERSGHPMVVLHHHAHVASCLVENGWRPDQGKVLALALDGLGMGDNGQLWGGELLVADYRHCHQIGGIPAISLPGGDAAAREPWRVLLAHLTAFLPTHSLVEFIDLFGDKPFVQLQRAMSQRLNSPSVRSAGRLFDAVAASLGVCFDAIEYEGQAACELEALASRWQGEANPGLLSLALNGPELDLASFWARWMSLTGEPAQKAYLFHQALARALAELALKGAKAHRLDTLVLTGGVFHNQLLTRLLKQSLDGQLHLLEHHHYPCGDGALALGQLAVALQRASA